MTRPSFEWVESAGTQLTEAPRVKATQFGDGYMQRAAAGINALGQAWAFRATGVDNAVADDIIAFFRARGGVEAFDYVPLWETTARIFICQRWTRTHSDVWGQCDVSGDFIEVFEP